MTSSAPQLRFVDLVSAAHRPEVVTRSQRTTLDTTTHDFSVGEDIANGGFGRSLLSRKRRRIMRASRRNFLRGSLFAASTAVAACTSKVGPAKAAEDQGVRVLGSFPQRIWTACPSDTRNTDCLPGCGPPPTCTDCCDADGYFRNDWENGFRLPLVSACDAMGTYVDGWLWSFSGICGNCTQVEYRCHDGIRLIEDVDGNATFQPYICRFITQCDGVETVIDATDDPAERHTYVGTIVSAVDNGDSTVAVTGWLAGRGDAQVEYSLTVGIEVVASGPADQPYETNIVGFGPNHGFKALIEGVEPGTLPLCMQVKLEGYSPPISCLDLVIADPAAIGTPTPVPTQTPEDLTPICGVLEVLRLEPDGTVFASGWACDRDTGASVEVGAMVNFETVHTVATSGVRADVLKDYPDAVGAQEFSLKFPLPEASAGAADVCITLVDPDNTYQPQLGCRTFERSS